jgi:hypothetical protein
MRSRGAVTLPDEARRYADAHPNAERIFSRRSRFPNPDPLNGSNRFSTDDKGQERMPLRNAQTNSQGQRGRSGMYRLPMNFHCVALVFGILCWNMLRAAECEVPSYVVPIQNVNGTLGACVTLGTSNATQSLAAVKALVDGWSCSAAAAQAISSELQCVLDDMSPREVLLTAAQELGSACASEGNGEKCALASAKAERAARLGGGEAAYIMYHAMVRGSYRGIRVSDNDVGRAVGYLEEAASAGIAVAETDLAIALVDTVDAGALEKMREPERILYKTISPSLQAKDSTALEQALKLLNSAAEKDDAHAMAVLIRAYELGVVELKDPELALAWAAVRDPKDDGTEEDADFSRLYRLSDKKTRHGACAKVRQITGRNINFRFLPGEIKNRFFMKCGGREAIVSRPDCVDAESLKHVEAFLRPLLLEHPSCKESR